MLEFTILKEPDVPYGSRPKNGRAKLRQPRQADILWKGLLEDVFEDLLLFLVPDVEKEFDLKRGFEFLNQELDQLFPPEGNEYRPMIIDKLVKIFKKDGKEEWVLVHLEVQDNYASNFNERMFSYFVRIFDKYRKPVTAFAILTEATSKIRSDSYEIACMGTHLVYRFNVFKIADQDERKLRASNNPFALAVLIAKMALTGKRLKKEDRDGFLLEIKIRLAKELLAKSIDKDKIRILMRFLTYYVRFTDEEKNIIFEQELAYLTERSTTMGLEELLLDIAKKEGIAEGQLKGKLEEQREIARELKKEGLAIEFIAKTTKLSIKEVDEL